MAIVNVTGSNSVNVFLGLGLPWMMGSLYWSSGSSADWNARYGASDVAQPFLAEGKAAFIVMSGSLGFSVICCCALATFAILGLRRHFFGGELGGPILPR